jgi:hypothetical protein
LTKTRGRPFKPGNPGRPKGARHKTTLAVESLLDGEAEKLTRKAIQLAMKGDTVALRICMDRIAPPRKGRAARFPIPPIKTSADVVSALAAVTAAVGRGEISSDEAMQLSTVIEVAHSAIKAVEHESRLAAIEGRLGMK